jgi:hypothetical protein
LPLRHRLARDSEESAEVCDVEAEDALYAFEVRFIVAESASYVPAESIELGDRYVQVGERRSVEAYGMQPSKGDPQILEKSRARSNTQIVG